MRFVLRLVEEKALIGLLFSLPFPRTTLAGYATYALCEILIFVHTMISHAVTVVMFISFVKYIITFCDDLSTVFDRIDASLERSDHISVRKLNANAVECSIKIAE